VIEYGEIEYGEIEYGEIEYGDRHPGTSIGQLPGKLALSPVGPAGSFLRPSVVRDYPSSS